MEALTLIFENFGDFAELVVVIAATYATILVVRKGIFMLYDFLNR